MSIDLSEIIERTVPVNQYINSLKQSFRERFLTRKQTYEPKQQAINELKKSASKCVIVAFSAEWCKDCAANIPVLALISEAMGMGVSFRRFEERSFEPHPEVENPAVTARSRNIPHRQNPNYDRHE
jgi:thiol-disulfide isomerase/thioredoxin